MLIKSMLNADMLPIKTFDFEFYYAKTSIIQNSKYLLQVESNHVFYTLIYITYIVWFYFVDDLLVR